MKRFFFILFIFLIWYMAAMYRIPSLMALSVAQLFLLLLLFLMTRYFRNNFQAGFCRKKETVRKKDRISAAFEPAQVLAADGIPLLSG